MQGSSLAKIRLHLARHGQTEQNLKGIVGGHQPGTLTQLGEKQAQCIGKYIHESKYHFDHIYVSDLGRAVSTLNHVKSQATNIKETPCTLTHLLREKSSGVLEGGPKESRDEAIRKSGLPTRLFRPQKGESRMDMHVRCFQFLKVLIEQNILGVEPKQQSEIHVFVVTHGGFLTQFNNLYRSLRKEYANKSADTAPNCSLHEYLISYPIGDKEYCWEKVGMECIREDFVDHIK